MDVTVQLRASEALDRQTVIDALQARLSVAQADIGAPVRRSDVLALLQRLPGALEIQRLELRGIGAQAYQTTAGDVRIPPDAIAVLRQANVELIRV